MTFIDEVFQPFTDFCHETNKMTHTISDKKVTINGMIHTVTAVDGLDRIDINTKLHYINVEMNKLKLEQSKLVSMRDMIDYEGERKELANDCDNLFDEMFGEQ